MNANQLIASVISGDQRAVARSMTLCENNSALAPQIIKTLYAKSGRAHVVGITGAPGAGKSTLVDQLALHWHKKGKKVAVLAVDPSSPFSGGAILGDRVRMQRTAAYPGIFIRSMASRGVLGGLSRAAFDAVTILDAAGFDLILLETVGVGQGEIDVVRTAHSCILVLVPGMGDEVQAFKAGILEIADIYVINKCDRDGVSHLERDLLTLLSLAELPEGTWKPTISKTIATMGDGASELVEKIEQHHTWFKSSNLASKRRKLMMRNTIIQLIRDRVEQKILENQDAKLDKLAAQCVIKKLSPSHAAEKLLSPKTQKKTQKTRVSRRKK